MTMSASNHGRQRGSSGSIGESGCLIVDQAGTILGFDEGAESLTGWAAIEVVGRHKDLRLVRTEGDGEALPIYEGDLTVPESATGTRELRFNCRDGRTVLVEALVQPLPGNGDRMLVRVLRVLARSAAPIHVDSLADLDPLCGLMCRGSFQLRLAEEYRKAEKNAKPLGLIVLDVDHLTRVNDKLGRQHGDELLRKLAGILRVTVGDETRIGRIGDDEFGIVMPNSGRGDARQLAAALRSTVERFRFFPETEGIPRVTLSLGAASYPADADNAADLLQRAQEALHEAQSLGRNRVWCYLRRPRVPFHAPVYFDGGDPLLVGYSRDLSPSGIFVQTAAPIDIGMRCAFTFPVPGHDGSVHVIGRVVRAVPPETHEDANRVPGLGVEFEQFGGPHDRRAIEAYLHENEDNSRRPESGLLSL